MKKTTKRVLAAVVFGGVVISGIGLSSSNTCKALTDNTHNNRIERSTGDVEGSSCSIYSDISEIILSYSNKP